MTVPPLFTACSSKYEAFHSSGRRPPGVVKWIVMHDTEGPTAESAAQWFANPRSAGSAHLVVDDTHCFRCLANNEIPWAAPGANREGFHIEQAGFAKWTSLIWRRSHRDLLRRAAYKTAYHLVVFNLPPVFVWAPGLRAGVKGVTTHAECTKAFGGDHTDPGFGWPRAAFMWWVRRYYAEIANA